ncbi:Splicing factor-like protein [Parasponia andersonii]|uniref:Splicing factor 3B subunit 4 n=1 Tax=Parasponia andersonii TaxID=3476 RepID=A0A2P5D333_PARAD|nr:Splicing factor-like protein [Parasponia andersonii]
MTTRIAPGVGANLLGQHSAERNQDATAYVGNLDPQVSEELLWELFVQAGPVVNVYVPKDRVTNLHQGYGFVEFRSEEDADYVSDFFTALLYEIIDAIKVLNMIKLYGKPIRVNKASQDKKSLDVGANLFIGNLDPDVDEKLLYDTFSAFGVIVTNPKIMRDPDTGNSRGFGFISYDSFEASDAAIEAMNGQYLCNRQITVSYAYKKDTKGERHGTPAERVLAASNPTSKSRPHTLFASGPPTLPNGPQVNGTMGAPVPPRPFANGAVAPGPIPPMRPPPPQGLAFPHMQVPGQPAWQGQPQQPGQGLPPPVMPPPPIQQFRPPQNMPPPPPQGLQVPQRPLPPPMGMGGQPPNWRPPPPPHQRPPFMPQGLIPPPPPPNNPQPPPPSG